MSPSRPLPVRIAIIVVASIGVLALVLAFFPWNSLRGPVARYASHKLGRTVAIAGNLDVRLGWTARIQADDVSIANAPWSSEPQMVHVQRMNVRVRLLSLFFGTPVIPSIDLTEPTLVLEKNKDGVANWVFEGGGGPSSVHLGTINVDRGAVRYRDPGLRADIAVKLQSAPAAGDAPPSIGFNGDGTLRDEPFHIDGSGLGLSALRNVDDPYRLSLHARAGSTDLRFAGTIVPSDAENLKGELRLQGKDLSELYPFVPLPLPWTPPYKLAGQLAHNGDHWSYRQFKGSVGDSDLSGDADVDQSRARPVVTADLSSRRFNYKDLGGIVGVPPGEAASGGVKAPEQQRATARRAASTRVLPDKPFELERLRVVDADIKFRGTSVTWSDAPIDNLSTHFFLKDGVVRFDPVDFGIGGGHVVGKLSLDANDKTARSQGDFEIRNVELKRVFPKLASPNGTAGRFGGRASFKTQGNSIAAMSAATNGEVGVLMRGGEASTLALVLTNLDLANALPLLLKGDETSEIHCAVASFGITNGLMVPNVMVVDTSAVTIYGTGSIDFRNEKYDLLLKPRSKKASILALHGPIVVGGTFKTPVIHPEVGALTVRLGAAAGLAALAPPLALLALIDTGGAPDVDCAQVVANAKMPKDSRHVKAPRPLPPKAATTR